MSSWLCRRHTLVCDLHVTFCVSDQKARCLCTCYLTMVVQSMPARHLQQPAATEAANISVSPQYSPKAHTTSAAAARVLQNRGRWRLLAHPEQGRSERDPDRTGWRSGLAKSPQG